jgi:hypothetical protein
MLFIYFQFFPVNMDTALEIWKYDATDSSFLHLRFSFPISLTDVIQHKANTAKDRLSLKNQVK